MMAYGVPDPDYFLITNGHFDYWSGVDLILGMWKTGFHGIYGVEIFELVEVNPFTLDLTENDYTSPQYWGDDLARQADAARYAALIREGSTPPPIDVCQTYRGRLRVTNGHRRVAAAKMTNTSIRAWVSWLMLTETGAATGLTLERCREYGVTGEMLP